MVLRCFLAHKTTAAAADSTSPPPPQQNLNFRLLLSVVTLTLSPRALSGGLTVGDPAEVNPAVIQWEFVR